MDPGSETAVNIPVKADNMFVNDFKIFKDNKNNLMIAGFYSRYKMDKDVNRFFSC